MIKYHFEGDFSLSNHLNYTEWLVNVVHTEGKEVGELNYIFDSDEALLKLNRNYLNHDYFTDILTFDYSEGPLVSGDIFISEERVKDNAKTFEVKEEDEFRRVMVHGVLHLLGYKDETDEEKRLMRAKEDEMLLMFHVEQE
jgi:rRNA maturation RNase YbeY